jgi:hypothetical protein
VPPRTAPFVFVARLAFVRDENEVAARERAAEDRDFRTGVFRVVIPVAPCRLNQLSIIVVH